MDGVARKPDEKDVVLWDTSHFHHDVISTKTYGFWLYMMSDAMIFASLFASYIVLSHRINMAGGPTPADVLHPVSAFWDTMLILASGLAYGVAMVFLKRGNRSGVMMGLGAAFILGLWFVGMELSEFDGLIGQGITAERSGYLSAFFTLVLTHGLHMLFGLLWILVMMVQVLRDGFTADVVYRLLNLKIFWFFQALVWVCVFSFVYLLSI